jgi:hypothetical protein
LLLIAGCLWAFSMAGNMIVTVLTYVFIHVAYTFGLKQLAVIDVTCIAVGFVLRVIGGAEAIAVGCSEWLLLCTFLLACFLGFAKRRQEIILLGDEARSHREVLLHYSPQMLDQILTLSAACSILAYALYTISAETRAKFDTQALLCTDQEVEPLQIVKWFVRRWQVEVTFHEVRTHLGVETQRQWTDLAIQRTTPALLGLFSLVTLLAHQATVENTLAVRQAAWYAKALPTFSDALAVVRRCLWSIPDFHTSLSDSDMVEFPCSLLKRLTEAVCYAT